MLFHVSRQYKSTLRQTEFLWDCGYGWASMSNRFTSFLAIVTLSITFNYWLKVLARVFNDVENPLKFPVCFHGAVPGFFLALLMLS